MTTKVKCHFPHIVSSYADNRTYFDRITSVVHIDLDQWPKQYWPSFFIVLWFPLLSALSSLEKRHYVQPTFWNKCLHSVSLRTKYLHKNFEFLCMGDLSVLPNLFRSIWPHRYLSYSFDYELILLYFSGSNWNSFSGLLGPFDMPHRCGCVF